MGRKKKINMLMLCKKVLDENVELKDIDKKVCEVLELFKRVFVDGEYQLEMNAVIDRIINEAGGLTPELMAFRNVIATLVPIARVGELLVVKCNTNEQELEGLGLKFVDDEIAIKEINEIDPVRLEEEEEKIKEKGCKILLRVPTII